MGASVRAEFADRGTEGETDKGYRPESSPERAAAGALRAVKEARSTGRATHAARIADEVHMDPPPQARIRVGHGPE
ncbi:hypothetical protein SY2F82_20030 [Streptomyces sp. Y2F8-2]|nr:hypothetical protein SY2F82_20030 [Streptomyces sp. Y2F8-2]